MADILFRMAAKTDVGLVRTNNEDNFQASADLSQAPMRWVNNQQYSLGPKGALLVVADGMGGMNAGEVASEIAINTVIDLFAPENITDEVAKSRQNIEKFMKGVVVEADARIKQHAKEFPESRGMGTTIVIAWIFDGYTYVAWCGDSRAYIFNPATGLFQISKDHSYVQTLVDEGKLTPEEAFDFPDSNIITRSLCDGGPKAQPQCLTFPQPLCDGDIILLCSDGLNGMIRDEEIEKIIAHGQNDLSLLVDQLIHAAKEAGGADNVTVALAQITSGGVKSSPDRIPFRRRTVQRNIATTIATDGGGSSPVPQGGGKSSKGLVIALVSLLLLVLAGLAVWRFCPGIFGGKDGAGPEATSDSVVSPASDNAGVDESKTGEDIHADEGEVTDGENDEVGQGDDAQGEGGGESAQPVKTQPSPRTIPVQGLRILNPQPKPSQGNNQRPSSAKGEGTDGNSPKKTAPSQSAPSKGGDYPSKTGADKQPDTKPAQGGEGVAAPSRTLPEGLTPINRDNKPAETAPAPEDAPKKPNGLTPIPRNGGNTSEMIQYVVRKGETLSSILGTNNEEIINKVAHFNNIDNPNHLQAGTSIWIFKRNKR